MVLALVMSCNRSSNEISLAGKWELCLDSVSDPHTTNPGQMEFSLSIDLPATLDLAGIGRANELESKPGRETMLHLRRKVSHIGPAWYRKEVKIPRSWKDKRIILELERVIWESVVWVDGKKAGNDYSLSTPHYCDLSDLLTAGKHTITICIDNSRKFVLNRQDMAHAYTEETQIKWNGILGKFTLTAHDHSYIESLAVYPDYKRKKLTGMISANLEGDESKELKINIVDGNNVTIARSSVPLNGKNTGFELDLTGEIKPWNEFSPELYRVTVSLVDR